MSETVINTVQFRFPVGSQRPTWGEIASFIKQLDTDPMLMETAYKTAQERSLFIKFTSPEAMAESLRKNAEPRKFVYASGKTIDVRMTIANLQYVRVFDLPPELTDYSLSLVLGNYGEIDHMVREKFPADLGLDHMFTGVRGIYMYVKKDIPPTIDVGQWKGRIFYEGLKDTCFLCREVGHRRDSCPQRQTRNKKDKEANSGSCSYADIVSGKAASPAAQHLSETPEDEFVDISDGGKEEEGDGDIDPSTEVSEAEQEGVDCATGADSEKRRQQKESMKKLEQVAIAIKEAMTNPQASQRRAQFAASGSGSGSAPKMKIARRTRY